MNYLAGSGRSSFRRRSGGSSTRTTLPGHAILRNQHGTESIRVLQEQRVVPDTKTDQDVELHLLGVQNGSLSNRAAHGLEFPHPHLLVVA
jgi:hypothetical protein